MDQFVITGGSRLRGTVEISGAKNAALPIMAASILCEGETILQDVPDLQDVRQMLILLEHLGVKGERDGEGALHLRVEDEMNCHAPYKLVSKMRASVCCARAAIGQAQKVAGVDARRLRDWRSAGGPAQTRSRRFGRRLRTAQRRYAHASQAAARGGNVFGRAIRFDGDRHGQRHDGRSIGRRPHGD